MASNDKPTTADGRRPLCFVVGPIGKDGTVERKHSDLLLHALIKHVLTADDFGYVVKRADEDADPGMIGDRVISDIINAELVIADLTDLNANAFYELGIRHSTEKPTIHIAKAGTVLPFDTVAHRTIFVDLTDWHSLEDARERLGNSARAVKSPGYRVSNPITQANASFKMRQSEDPRDRALAAIQERLDAIERRRPDDETLNKLFTDSFKQWPADTQFFFDEASVKARLAWMGGASADAIENSLLAQAKESGIPVHVSSESFGDGGRVINVQLREDPIRKLVLRPRPKPPKA
jgi:hypothetical protein